MKLSGVALLMVRDLRFLQLPNESGGASILSAQNESVCNEDRFPNESCIDVSFCEWMLRYFSSKDCQKFVVHF